MGTSEAQRHISALASGSPVARRFGVPAGGWKNYLRPSADVARPRFIRRTIFQAETCSLERSAHACGQAQVADHSISRLGADRSPASRTEAVRERGCFTIGGRPVTFELNMNMPPNKCAPANRRYGFSARCGLYRMISLLKCRMIRHNPRHAAFCGVLLRKGEK